MFVPPIVHNLADFIAGPVGASRGRIVTGLLGWGCAVAFAGLLITSLFGLPVVAGWLGSIAVFLFPVADRLVGKHGPKSG